MTRLSWGKTGERFFESGADRGVLFVGLNDGVPWNGLKSVSESPEGGEPRPFFIDGYKYINVASAEEFKATLSAFSAPLEFGVCDGTMTLQKGLFATQQPRKPFSLSYRTLVGNDIQGSDYGYKVHLVYNALAGPSTRENASITNSATPLSLSWTISTTPPKITGLRPTSHFVIDSRYTPASLMAAIEDILYGTSSTAPRMPTVTELVALFASPGPITHRNLVKNPVGPSTSGDWLISARWFGGGGAGNVSYVTGAVDGPMPEITSYIRKTWTTKPTGTSAGDIAFGTGTRMAVTPGQVYAALSFLRGSWNAGIPFHSRIRFEFYAASSGGTATIVEGPSVPYTLGQWGMRSHEATVPAGMNFMTIVDYFQTGVDGANGFSPPIGATLDGTGFFAEVGSVGVLAKLIADGGFFFGGTPDTPIAQYDWEGTINASPSTKRTWY